MSEERTEVVRLPMEKTTHPRRRLVERIALRSPRLRDFVARAVWRLPNQRLRRAALRRFVRTSWEGFNRGDLDVAFLLYRPDCESIYPPQFTTLGLEPGTHDLEERMRSQQSVLDEWAEFWFEPEELIDLVDGRLLSTGRMKGIGLSSGAPFETEWSAIVTIRDGRVIKEEIFVDHGEALEAAGLAE
jgi:ketosteroid isomerase-like protein